jgi:hypothetical protein
VNSKLWKLALAGAITTVAIDYFLKPTVNKNLGIK